eukprot:295109-Amphidinium_carterae.1
MHTEVDDRELHFRTDLEGGAWSVQRSSRFISGIRSFVRKQSPLIELCAMFGVSVSASFSQEKFGHENSVALSDLWKFRLHKLWEAWAEAGQPVTFPAHGYSEHIPGELKTKVLAMSGESAKRRDVIIKMITTAPWALEIT